MCLGYFRSLVPRSANWAESPSLSLRDYPISLGSRWYKEEGRAAHRCKHSAFLQKEYFFAAAVTLEHQTPGSSAFVPCHTSSSSAGFQVSSPGQGIHHWFHSCSQTCSFLDWEPTGFSTSLATDRRCGTTELWSPKPICSTPSYVFLLALLLWRSLTNIIDKTQTLDPRLFLTTRKEVVSLIKINQLVTERQKWCPLFLQLSLQINCLNTHPGIFPS